MPIPSPFVRILAHTSHQGIRTDRTEVHDNELILQREGDGWWVGTGYLCTMVFRLEEHGKLSSAIYLQTPDGETERYGCPAGDADHVRDVSLVIFRVVCDTHIPNTEPGAAA